jgi:antitoxin component YwqK of YwqJK toxin-antitoxin module
VGNYINDNRSDGKWTFYYSNGKKSAEGPYQNGYKEGTWLYWDKQGKQSTKKEIELTLAKDNKGRKSSAAELLKIPYSLIK